MILEIGNFGWAQLGNSSGHSWAPSMKLAQVQAS